jgi:hypothetical protein
MPDFTAELESIVKGANRAIVAQQLEYAATFEERLVEQAKRLTWVTRTSSTRFAIRNCRPIVSKTSGGDTG